MRRGWFKLSDITLPDFLQDETEEVIMARMIARLPPDLDASEGSYLWDALAPAAAEVAQMKLEAREILKRAFIQYSYGAYVDARAADRGMTRIPAVKATGQVQVTGKSGTTFPAGTVFSTTADLTTGTPGIEFVSISQAVIEDGGVVMVSVEAVEAGTSGNVPAGAINQLVSPITGVVSINNPQTTSGGLPSESDKELVARYMERSSQIPGGGNKYDYILWAKEVPGVGDAVCLPLWHGPGSVKVVIVDSNGVPANTNLVQQVQDYISPAPGKGEGKAPTGANVTVVAPTAVDIVVSATLLYSDGHDPATVRSNVDASIKAAINELKTGEGVRYVTIANLIYDTPGVTDYFNLLVNEGAVNVAVTGDQKAVIREIALT